jgi:sugar phosphate isomerase/epimerase
MKPVSLQLYSLRPDVYAGGGDLPGVVRTVAEIGYKGVEFAGLYGNDPKDLGKLVSDLGMQVSSTHGGIPTEETIQQIADTELALGNTRLISGFGPDDFKTVDACKIAAGKFSKAAELLAPYGISFGFHNHWWEFFTLDGKYVYDILMEEAPNVFSELDVYWCAYGKGDPVKIISKYGARLPVLHIKDGPLTEGEPHTAVGSGVLDIPAIVGAADPNVLKWLIVELDNCKTDMLAAVKQSYKYLTTSGLAEGNK